jgi:hypothetical protein
LLQNQSVDFGNSGQKKKEVSFGGDKPKYSALGSLNLKKQFETSE